MFFVLALCIGVASTSILSENDIDISDIANYPITISHILRERIIRTGPIQVDMEFPKSNVNDNRTFSKKYYSKVMPNGEEVKRDWLVYSKRLDAVHCFCCRLFREHKGKHFAFAYQGFNDWQHLSDRIKEHELSSMHASKYKKWKEVTARILSESTIDFKLSEQYQNERARLRKVFDRLIAFVLLFARQNIAFAGSSHNARGQHNGNFQQFVQTVAKFDEILKQHLEKSNHVHYLSPQIQNELIAIIAAKVLKEILLSVKKSKYYAIIVDSTPDISRKEQVTLILRYVALKEKTNEYEIKESFIEFVEVTDKSGVGIADVIIQELERFELNVFDLRGQGYDNGANMEGKNVGVQRIILNKNPRAFFVPCSNHSLNLVVNEAACSSIISSTFFSLVEKVYTFLSASTNRWDILKSNLSSSDSVPKAICTTRWSSRIDAIKPLRQHLKQIIAALTEISGNSKFDSLTL